MPTPPTRRFNTSPTTTTDPARAEQRVKLGLQLFKAAEARLAAQHDTLAQIKSEQANLRESIQHEVAKSLQTYDQWMGRIDESFTTAVRDLTTRLDKLETDFADQLTVMNSLLARIDDLTQDSAGGDAASATSDTPHTPNPDTDHAVFLRVLRQLEGHRDDDRHNNAAA
ncbi:MAG: hypothetical protein AAF797_06950 [Planctomycetota bacterium]